MADAEGNNKRRLFLVSIPRTASNLLVKVLNIQHQPDVFTNDKLGYFFYEVYMTPVVKGYFTKPVDQWTDAEKTEVRTIYQRCLDRLEGASEEAERNDKIMFTKEHAFWFVNPVTMLDTTGSRDGRVQQDEFRLSFPEIYGPRQTFSPNNKTVLPDEYLRTWKFAFLIRHPALAWPSMYRAMQKVSKLGFFDDDGVNGALVANMTWKWTRHLYDWCTEYSSESPNGPLILDAHDIIHNQDIVLRFCELTGLDKSAVQFEWEGDKLPKSVPEDSTSKYADLEVKAAHIMISTLKESKGIIKDRTPAAVDIAAEVEKWKAEFGLNGAALLEKTVRESMSDYEYLRERRLQM
ncbi:hypothetical protein OQA88_6090 [Cercophora sp. LCS_1]